MNLTKLNNLVTNSNKHPMNIKYNVETRTEFISRINSAKNIIFSNFSDLIFAYKYLCQVKEYKTKIIEDINFRIPMTKYKYVTKPLGNTYQRCSKCEVDCCQICVWPP